MSVAPGTRLGHYEILGKIGQGGMGEVYRARDTQLDRVVAIKILPDVFAGDPGRLMRFEREAKTLAALNHPNIAQIYGLERSATAQALVLELIDGVALDDSVDSPQPVADALTIAKQIADALDFAHERGIVHRDLKPANVMLTPNGAVKVLDFGLAKAMSGAGVAPSGSELMNSPTFTSPAVTNIGMILGTAAYMAPEQAKGKPVDRRADIWALGVVLFEMLSGRRLYAGETVTETIAQVITQPPDWDALPAGTPPAVKRLLRRCLEKDPRNRFQSAGDVRVEIEEILAAPASDFPSVTRVGRPRLAYLPWAIGGVLFVALLVSILRPFTSHPADAPAARLEVRLSPGELAHDDNIDGALVILSPDGRMLAYAENTDQGRRLFVRSLDSLTVSPLEGTDGAISHTFSPDGRWLAFVTPRGLKKVAINGGVVDLAAVGAGDARGIAWGRDDTLVYTAGTTVGLSRISAAGGQPVELTKPVGKERTHRWPSFLPDGKTVLFVCQLVDGRYDDGTIEAIRIDEENPARKVLIRGGTFPRYLASGHLAFIREGTLFAVPFDAGALEVRGTPQPVLTGVLSHGGSAGGDGNGASQIAFSDSGTAAYIAGGIAENASRVVITDRSARTLHMTTERGDLRAPRFSPDGREVAIQARLGSDTNIHVWDPIRRTLKQVTFEKSFSGFPIWSPDGTRIAFFSEPAGGAPNPYLARSDGAGEPQRLIQTDALLVPVSFTPDGSRLAIMQQTRGGFDIVVLTLASKTVTLFLDSPAEEMLPAFSPDGRWIAYQSDESGAFEVYVRPFPGPGGKWRVSAGGGLEPVWAKSGRELFYVAGPLAKARIMSVAINGTGEALHHDAPKLVFETSLARLTDTSHFDVSPDGTRFALLKEDETAPLARNTHVTLIFNFYTEVRRAFLKQP